MSMMSWATRKYYDDETRRKMREAFPDESLLKQIESAYESSLNDVERREIEIEGVYENVAGLLSRVSELSGVSQEHLLIIARRIATMSRDMEWWHVLRTIESFYRIKDALLTEEKGEQK